MRQEFQSQSIPGARDADPAGIKRDPDGKFSSGGGGGSAGETGKNIASGIAKQTDNEDAGKKEFPTGTMVKPNRQGAAPSKVAGHRGNMLVLENGDLMHRTKAVKA